MRNIDQEMKDGTRGDPEAVFCGWCDTGRVRVRGGYLCRTCDAPAAGLLRPTWEENP